MINNKVETIKEHLEEIMKILEIERTESNKNTPLRVAKMWVNELFAKGNEEYQDIVEETLSDYLYENIVMKGVGVNYDINKVHDTKWEITDDGRGNIDRIRIFFHYDASDTVHAYYITSVSPKVDLTVEDLCKPDADKLEEAFDTHNYLGAPYSKDFAFTYNPSIQNTKRSLALEINKIALKEAGISEITNTFFIRDDGTTIEDGIVQGYTIVNITDNGYNQYSINIRLAEDLTDSLDSGDYRFFLVTSNENKFSNRFIECDS